MKPAKSAAEAAKSGIELSDEYTVRLGRKISDGLLDNVHPYLAQVHKETTITPAADGAHTWKVDGELLNEERPWRPRDRDLRLRGQAHGGNR